MLIEHHNNVNMIYDLFRKNTKYTGVSRETPQGGGGFIFGSFKLNQEKNPTFKTVFHRF